MNPFLYKNIKGLSSEEVVSRQKLNGFNELPSSKPKSVFSIILQVIREPMFLLLVACGTLYMWLGDTGEGLMLLSSVIIIIIITFYQEKKTERALEALRDLSSPRTLVIRNGVEKRMASRELVVDDMIVLQEGDRVTADAIVIHALNLKTDESMLTGESAAVQKSEWDGKKEFSFTPGENQPFVYSGSLVTQGHGLAKVEATGIQSQLGQIGKSLQQLNEEPTLLKKEINGIVKTFSLLGFGVCIFVIIIYGLTRADWLHGVLTGLSLAMAMLPEEFPVVLTIFMALGAWRMSKLHILTRKPASIETLGSVTVLCADKTGTLTQNMMSVRMLFSNGQVCSITEDKCELEENFHSLVEYGILSSQVNPFDPMEKAIARLGELKLKGTGHLHSDWQLEKEYPLSPALLAMSRVFHAPGRKQHVVAAKGSPEAIAQLCHMDKKQWNEVEKHLAKFASEGLRVLGVAHAIFKPDLLPTDQHEFEFEFNGLIGLQDPLRENISENLKICYDAGIRVIMITGDYPATAQTIARKMGLKNPEEVITGKELKEMNSLQIREKIRTTNIFARVMPEQKLMLVEALKENGEIVAMTGDGVNDAPALKSAHVGIAMGERGTDVAREAAGIVLTDDNFSSIVAAIRSGRRIYDNMQKAMAYIFSVHVPVAGLTMIPVFFPAYPMILFPLHIAFLELIIDPACSLIFENEAEEKNIMKRPPREQHKPVFGLQRILVSSLQGLFVTAFCLMVYYVAFKLNRPENEIRALTFTTLVFANLGLIFINRSWTRTIIETFRDKNKAVKWISGAALLLLSLVLFVPALRNLFHFDKLHADDLLICFAAGAMSILWFEGKKLLSGKT
jgi:Ca2+-transporting ATPase